MVTVHRAFFADQSVPAPEYYFINVTNMSLTRAVEVTHIWFECSPKVVRNERPLPKRLKVDEQWSTWVEITDLGSLAGDDKVYKLARVQLSTGKVFRSKENKGVPSFGNVPGGDPPPAPTGFHPPTQPEIISADWGIGEPNYRDKRGCCKATSKPRGRISGHQISSSMTTTRMRPSTFGFDTAGQEAMK